MLLKNYNEKYLSSGFISKQPLIKCFEWMKEE